MIFFVVVVDVIAGAVVRFTSYIEATHNLKVITNAF